jgi:hypothetical protein
MKTYNKYKSKPKNLPEIEIWKEERLSIVEKVAIAILALITAFIFLTMKGYN